MIIFVNDFVIAWKNSSKQNSTITAADMSARSSLIMQISVDGKDKKKNFQEFLSVFLYSQNAEKNDVIKQWF